MIDLAVDVKDPSKEMASIDKEMTVKVTDLNGDKCSDLAVDVAGKAIGLTAADFEAFGVKDGGGDSLPDASVYECVYYGQVATIECGPGIQCPIPLCTKWRWVCDPRWF